MTDNRTTEQTAMERFRTALEERGIEFETDDDECAEGEERMTLFKANLGESEFDIFVTAKDWYFDGKLTPWLDVEFHNMLTPEQAIAATLGNTRAERTHAPVFDGKWFRCSACNESLAMFGVRTKNAKGGKVVREIAEQIRFCPWCGERLVDA